MASAWRTRCAYFVVSSMFYGAYVTQSQHRTTYIFDDWPNEKALFHLCTGWLLRSYDLAQATAQIYQLFRLGPLIRDKKTLCQPHHFRFFTLRSHITQSLHQHRPLTFSQTKNKSHGTYQKRMRHASLERRLRRGPAPHKDTAWPSSVNRSGHRQTQTKPR